VVRLRGKGRIAESSWDAEANTQWSHVASFW